MLFRSKDLQAIATARRGVVMFDECFFHDHSNSAIQVAMIIAPEDGEQQIVGVFLDTAAGFTVLPHAILSDKFRKYVEEMQ